LTKDKKITPPKNKERSEKQMNNSIVAELPGIDREFKLKEKKARCILR